MAAVRIRNRYDSALCRERRTVPTRQLACDDHKSAAGCYHGRTGHRGSEFEHAQVTRPATGHRYEVEQGVEAGDAPIVIGGRERFQASEFAPCDVPAWWVHPQRVGDSRAIASRDTGQWPDGRPADFSLDMVTALGDEQASVRVEQATEPEIGFRPDRTGPRPMAHRTVSVAIGHMATQGYRQRSGVGGVL